MDRDVKAHPGVEICLMCNKELRKVHDHGVRVIPSPKGPRPLNTDKTVTDRDRLAADLEVFGLWRVLEANIIGDLADRLIALGLHYDGGISWEQTPNGIIVRAGGAEMIHVCNPLDEERLARAEAALVLAHDYHDFGREDCTPANCSAEAYLSEFHVGYGREDTK